MQGFHMKGGGRNVSTESGANLTYTGLWAVHSR